MAWTEITRAEYSCTIERYANDLINCEWKIIALFLPLPKEFPPSSAIQRYFYGWYDWCSEFNPFELSMAPTHLRRWWLCRQKATSEFWKNGAMDSVDRQAVWQSWKLWSHPAPLDCRTHICMCSTAA